LRLFVADGRMLERLEPAVARAFEAALARLAAAGVRIEARRSAGVRRAADSGVQGIIASAEAWALHRALIEARERELDPRVAPRIRGGAAIGAAEYVEAVRLRAGIVAGWAEESAGCDAWIAPTVACTAPPLAPLERDDLLYARADLRALRNTSIVNALDGCALTLPCQAPGDAPVGLMLFAPPWRDRTLLAVGLAVEAALA
jgi:Asp-tRNA(Asn)/Glu-tRNA(Gln) amidotransferase A subunit family amidase